jgi:hypothetical protein
LPVYAMAGCKRQLSPGEDTSKKQSGTASNQVENGNQTVDQDPNEGKLPGFVATVYFPS